MWMMVEQAMCLTSPYLLLGSLALLHSPASVSPEELSQPWNWVCQGSGACWLMSSCFPAFSDGRASPAQTACALPGGRRSAPGWHRIPPSSAGPPHCQTRQWGTPCTGAERGAAHLRGSSRSAGCLLESECTPANSTKGRHHHRHSHTEES